MTDAERLVYLTRPRWFFGTGWWRPLGYLRSDTTTATWLGCPYGLIALGGGAVDERVLSEPDSASGKRPSPPSIENILNAPSEPVGTTTVAELLAAAGFDPTPPDMESVDCDECDGYGEATCYACGNDHDCERCDGTGKISEAPVPDPEYVGIGPGVFDRRYLAALLAGLPDGPVAVAVTKVAGMLNRVVFAGDGWRATLMCVTERTPSSVLTLGVPGEVPAVS